MADHQCFMKPLSFSNEKRQAHAEARFMFFDYETYVNEAKELVPNLAIVQYDTGQQFVFPSSGNIGQDVTEELCHFIFTEQHQDFFVIAHNFQSFDGLFVLRWLLNNGIKADPIMNGGKIVSMVVSDYHVTFRDSLAFVPTSLAGFPALVGIPDLRKGDFPHRFNRRENWNRIVPFPTLDDFEIARRKDKDQQDLRSWYEKERNEKNGMYDFNKEFITYCEQVRNAH